MTLEDIVELPFDSQ